MAQAGAVNSGNIDVPDGWRLVYKRESVVGVYMNGALFDREIVEPALVSLPSAASSLFYKYRVPDGEAYVPHDQVQQTGQEWGWELWSAETGEFRDVDADG